MTSAREERKQTVRELFETGNTPGDIADALKMAYSTVCRDLRDSGIHLNQRKILDSNEIIARYNHGETTTEIASFYGVDRNTVCYHLRKTGIDLISRMKEGHQKFRQTRGDEPHRVERRNRVKQLYVDKDLPATKIAVMEGVTLNTVLRDLKDSGVQCDKSRKISNARKGKPLPREVLEKQIATRKANGYTHSEETRRKISASHEGRKYSEEQRTRMADAKWKRATYYREKHPFFCSIEEIRDNPDPTVGEVKVQVRCKFCGEWFTPGQRQLDHRISELEHPQGDGGSYFYCSKQCQNKCPVFGLHTNMNLEKSLLPSMRELQTWSDHVIKRDGECQLCGTREKLHAHHIKPKMTHPFFALDPDNGVTLCKSCHHSLHTGECSTTQIRFNKAMAC